MFQKKTCNFVTEVRLLYFLYLNTIMLICLDPVNTNEKKLRLYFLTVSLVSLMRFVYSTRNLRGHLSVQLIGVDVHFPFRLKSELRLSVSYCTSIYSH